MYAPLRTIAAAGLALGLAGPAFAQSEPVSEINFGIISTESQQNLRPKWQPFLEDMEEKTGLTVNPFFATDYAGVIEGMRFGKVQIGWFGNKSAMEAVDRAGGEIFAQTVDGTGNPGYWSLVIVPVESPVEDVADLLTCDKSMDFGLGDVNSTSGYLVPMTFVFAENGVDPKDCFGNVTNANHESNAMAVANGQLDAATNNTESLALIEENQPAAFDRIRVIWKSPLIPSDPLVWSKDLPQEAKDRISTFILTYGTDQTDGDAAEERRILAGLDWAPFQPSADDQLLPIRVMEATKAIAEIENDATLDEAEKKARIDDLTAEKAAYQDRIAATDQGA